MSVLVSQVHRCQLTQVHRTDSVTGGRLNTTFLLTDKKKSYWTIPPSLHWRRLHNPMKASFDGELHFNTFQSNVIAWFWQALALAMLNRQRLLGAYLITVHQRASFIPMCGEKRHTKWHIFRCTVCGRVTGLENTNFQNKRDVKHKKMSTQ